MLPFSPMVSSQMMPYVQPTRISTSLRQTGKPPNPDRVLMVSHIRKATVSNHIRQWLQATGNKMDQCPVPLLATHQLGGPSDARRILLDLLEAKAGGTSMVKSLLVVRINLNDNYCSSVSPALSLMKQHSVNSVYNQDSVFIVPNVNFITLQ